jgi:hypothetical protein
LTPAATVTVCGSDNTTPAHVNTAAQLDTATGANGATFSSGPSAAAIIIMPTLDMELTTTSTDEAPVTVSDEPARTLTSSGVTSAGTTAMNTDATLPLLSVTDLDELLKQW